MANVHAEFADVLGRLLAAETVLVAGREFGVVVQLDGAQRLVLRELPPVMLTLSVRVRDGCLRSAGDARQLRVAVVFKVMGSNYEYSNIRSYRTRRLHNLRHVR